jgi:predicted porin
MRKTITALAALTVTASALADYAFYGVLDDAVYQESKVTATSTASKILATKQNKMFSAKDNSRFGVKGDKEFNDGLKGIYQFEVQLDQNGTTLFGNNRTAWVGLEGKAGAVRLGNMDTLVYNVFSAMDVNGRVEYKPPVVALHQWQLCGVHQFGRLQRPHAQHPQLHIACFQRICR